jgi:hypothetical protein
VCLTVKHRLNKMKEFDLIIKKQSGEDESQFGYDVKGVIYDFYYKRPIFDRYVEELKAIKLTGKNATAFDAYNDGKGGELSDKYCRKRKKYIPAKMASVASSSRFCVEAILKGDKDELAKVFGLSGVLSIDAEHETRFQKGGLAPQLDAYLADENQEIFIETKCHEIFYSHDLSFRKSYATLFSRYNPDFQSPKINQKGNFTLDRNLLGLAKNSTLVFDARQALAHLLGIRKQHVKKATVVFLFFKPCENQIYQILEEQTHAFISSTFVRNIIGNEIDVIFAYEASPKMVGLNLNNYQVFNRLNRN